MNKGENTPAEAQSTPGVSVLRKEGSQAFMVGVLSVALGFGYNAFVARAFGPEGKGLLDLSSATANLLALLFGCSLGTGATQLVAAKGGVPSGLPGKLTFLALGLGLGGSALLLLFPELCSRWHLLPEAGRNDWALVAAANLTLGIVMAGWRGLLVGAGALRSCNRIDLMTRLLITLLAAYAVLASLWGTNLAMSPLQLGACLLGTALFQCLLYGRLLKGQPRWRPALLREMLPTCVTMHATNILHHATHRIDVFFVTAAGGLGELGIYSLAVSLSQLVLLASSAFAQPLLPAAAAASSADKATELTAGICRVYLLAASVLAGGLLLFAPLAIPLAFGQGFGPSVRALAILLPGVVAFGLTNIIISHFVARGKSHINLWVALIGTAATLLGNITLTLRYGYLAAASVSTISYALTALFSIAALSEFKLRRAAVLFLPAKADWVALISSVRHLKP